MLAGPLSGDVAISVGGLTVADGELTIAKTNGLQTALDPHTGQIAPIKTSLDGLGNSFYTETEVDAFLAAKQDALDAQTSHIIDVGRGDVYLENNPYDTSNGVGITHRGSVADAASIFAVRQMSGPCALLCGNTMTAVTHPFYCGYINPSLLGDETITTNYPTS